MDQIPIGLANGLGVAGVLALLFWLLSTGRLVTRREADNIAHDRNEWRTESRIKDQQIAEYDEQVRSLSAGFATVEALLKAATKAPS